MLAEHFDAALARPGHVVTAEPTTAVGCCAPLAREPLTGDQAVELARVFKAMGDPVRLRLLSLITSHEGGEACDGDLTDVFDLTGPTISHHLKVLRRPDSITGERRGTWVFYRIQPDALRLRLAASSRPTQRHGRASPDDRRHAADRLTSHAMR